MRLINLGCGPDGIIGWENYDWGLLPMANKYGLTKILITLGLLDKRYRRDWPKFSMADVRRNLPIENGKVDWVYCSHVIEHLEKYEALSLLKEIKRVLKKGGRTRIVMPDLNLIIKKYGTSPNEFNNKYWGYDKDKRGGILNRFIRPHNWMYNVDTFSELLIEAGFKKIEVLEFRKSEMPDVKKLDLAIHSDLSFYIEAEN